MKTRMATRTKRRVPVDKAMGSTTELLKDTLLFLRTQLKAIAAVLFPVIIPLELLNSAVEVAWIGAEEAPFPWWLYILDLMVYPIYQGALIFWMAARLSGESLPPSQCYKKSVAIWPQLMLVYVLSSMAVMAGFLLLLIPGFIALARVAFADFFCALQGRNAFDSIIESFKATADFQWVLLKGLLLIILTVGAASWGIHQLLLQAEFYNFATAVVLGIAESLLFTLALIYAFRVYCLYQDRRQA